MMESMHVTDITQFALFVREVDMDFNTTEELPVLMGQ
jgi:hypothetical protein